MKTLGRFVLSFFIYIAQGCSELFGSAWKWAKRIFIICALAAVLLVVFSDYIARYAINNSANYMDLNANVEEVDLSLLTQRIKLKNITLKNPDGFPNNNILSASTLTFKFDIFNAKNPIKRIYLQDAKIRVEGRSGRRIMATSFFRSNVYVVAREIGRVFDVKLETLIFGKKSNEKKLPQETSGNDVSICERFKILEGIDEIRLEKITIENGADSYGFESAICNENVLTIGNFRSTIFGVKFGARNLFFDIKKNLFGLAGFSIRNPEGFKRNSVFSIKKLFVKLSEKKNNDGKYITLVDSINVDSPTVHFEDKNGSMLGAIGMDNNFAGLYNTVDSLTHAKLSDMFQDEFESVPRSQEYKLPEIKFDNINITNARIVSQNKDAGLLANKIQIGKNKICIDDIRGHFGGLKLELDGVVFDSANQLFSAKDFMLRNPAGFPEESAFRFRNFLMSTNFSERVLRGNRVVQIDRIEVNKFFVRLDSRSGSIYDLIGDDNNLYALLDAIAATTVQMPVYQAAVQKQINESKTSRPYKYILKSLKFTDGKILIGPRGDSIKIPFENIEEKDLGVQEKGLTSQELTTKILKKIIVNSIDGAQSKVSEEIGGVLLAPIISILRTIITMF